MIKIIDYIKRCVGLGSYCEVVDLTEFSIDSRVVEVYEWGRVKLNGEKVPRGRFFEPLSIEDSQRIKQDPEYQRRLEEKLQRMEENCPREFAKTVREILEREKKF